MEVIWSQGPSTAAGCRAALLPTHPVNGGTVSTVLRHLEQKGLLKHRVGVDERTYIYEATHPRRHFAARAVQNIIDRFCGGSVEQLLVGLVENKVLKQKDLDHLARYSASQRAEKK
jgi:predicted transcriptional regulator